MTTPDLDSVFDVFSLRSSDQDTADVRLTRKFKVRLYKWLVNTYRDEKVFWDDVHHRLEYVFGDVLPIPDARSRRDNRKFRAIAGYLGSREDINYFDFIEQACRSEYFWRQTSLGRKDDTPYEFVKVVNRFFDLDNLPYSLTDYVEGRSHQRDYSGRRGTLSRPRGPYIRVYPQIIHRDSEVLHETAIKPTLALLSQPMFMSANEEFLNALKDFRTGDYGDCVVKCGSSLESVMKIICHQRGWPYQQTDTAGPLLKHILPKTELDSYFEQPIMLIATIRNRLSTAHGAGTQQKAVPEHVANYVINSTAAAILLIVGETNL